MTDCNRRPSRTYRPVAAAAAVGLAVAAIFAGTPDMALAHSFIVTLDATAAERPVQLTSAIQGMRLAAAERDSHAAETSDGHLGGIDLFIRVQPAEAADGITWLKGAPDGPATIVVDFSGFGSALSRVAQDGGVVIGPGTLPADEVWSADAPATADGFVARYRAAYGSAPDRLAAEGYNAALRIDRAVRDRGGVQDGNGLQAALDLSADGMEWQ